MSNEYNEKLRDGVVKVDRVVSSVEELAEEIVNLASLRVGNFTLTAHGPKGEFFARVIPKNPYTLEAALRDLDLLLLPFPATVHTVRGSGKTTIV